MSVEGMWAVFYAELEPGQFSHDSGIIVLESGEVFGGDSLIAFRGQYEVNGNQITAQARTWSYNPLHESVMNVFGRIGKLDTQTALEGTVTDGYARGHIWEVDRPELRLPVTLIKIDELP